MNGKKWTWRTLLLLGILFFIIGIPVIINECYQTGTGYLTLWNPADVLAYYGTMLGALIAVITLSITILFTRKQIKRESYLNEEQAKWKQLEDLSIQCIDKIDPIYPLRQTMEVGQKDPFNAIRVFQQYQMTCRTSTDYFLAYIAETEFEHLKELLQKISNTSEIYFGLAGKEIEYYNKMMEYQGRNDALNILNKEKASPGSFNAETIQYCKKIVHNTDGITLDQIQTGLRDTNQKMISTYEAHHRPLLQTHRATFDKINKEVQQEADSILLLWKNQ